MGVDVVAGGAGFIGNHLCRRLLAEGHTVHVVDDLSTGRPSLVADLLDCDRFTLDRADVRTWRPDSLQMDRIWNLASPAEPEAYLADPTRTLDVNANGTRNLLEVARDSDALFLLASTSEIYGDPQVSPQPETYPGNLDAAAPRNVYAEAKRFAESLTLAAGRAGVSVRVARLFNVYGPGHRLDDGRVVPRFVRALQDGLPLPIAGDGLQTRSFCFIADMVDGLLARMDCDRPEPVNLGRPEEVSIRRLGEMMAELVGVPLRMERSQLPADEPRTRCPDATRAKQWLDWEATTPLEEGLQATMAATE